MDELDRKPDRELRLRVVASMGAKAPLTELLPRYEDRFGHCVEARYASSTAISEMIYAETEFDLIIVTQSALSALDGRGIRTLQTARFGTTLTSLAFPGGAQRPDVSKPRVLSEIVARARAVSLSDPTRGGSSSRFFLSLADALGFGEVLRRKAIFTDPGEGAVPVSDGRADFGVAQASEIALAPGLACVPLSLEDPQARSDYMLCLSRSCHPASTMLGDYLLCAETRDIRTAKGLLC